MVPDPTQSFSPSEKQYHVPHRAGKKLSIFFANPGYRITQINRPGARDVHLAIGPPMVFSGGRCGAPNSKRVLHIRGQKGMETP
jgi:hypothetical protein